MDSKVYSKNDILNKLAQDGFFVDLLTLDSFLGKYKIEAIFEDENGCEFFDKSAYDILVENVLNKKSSDSKQENILQDADVVKSEDSNIELVQDEVEITEEPLNLDEFSSLPVDSNDDSNSGSLDKIKWHKWDDVSKELKDSSSTDKTEIIEDAAQAISDDSTLSNIVQEQQEENADLKTEPVQEDTSASDSAINETKKQLQEVISSEENTEEDFDDIELLSDSIQAQEKFQKYIVSELAKRNVDVTPPKNENAFKFDISEKTLNMIARAIAKKIAKQVSLAISTDRKNDEKLLQAEKNSLALEQKVNSLEEQNRKLKLLLAESNKNLNSYQPTFFGLYRFVRNKSGKRK